MKYLARFLLSVITIFVIFLLIIALIFLINKNEKRIFYLFDTTFFIATGNSMMPFIEQGDLLIVKKQKEYQEKDIISFYNASEMLISTHRIIKKDANYYETKGDNNNFIDGYKVKNQDIYFKVIY